LPSTRAKELKSLKNESKTKAAESEKPSRHKRVEVLRLCPRGCGEFKKNKFGVEKP